MSQVLVAPGVLARDQWPTAFPRLQRLLKPFEDLRSCDKVPLTLLELLLWAYVTRATSVASPGCTHMLVYTQSGTNKPVEVSLQLQGFIKKMNVQTFGDWDRSLGGAGAALQYLVLTSGAHIVPFKAQCSALRMLRDCIQRSLGGALIGQFDGNRICLERRVFRKVVRGLAQQTALTKLDDPEGLAKVVEGEWVVSEKLDIGYQDATGKVHQCPAALLQEGDFVDVEVSLAIYMRGRRPSSRTAVEVCKLENDWNELPPDRL
ncbi:hypothetical protein NM688_g4000 [Phlebia brevispora]|uniref:Uncharacterized protein n=1 Tax=Phlebia brevispora TaxID=194682 RepID=A0ACC1T4U5_9APHY|nr:hypothetical protein NM688_g4000 [Phlebia brevispora]